MPSLKAIRKRIISVKSTQKITRAMKMVAGARLNRAQQRITDLRPYAVKTHDVLAEVTWSAHKAEPQEGGEGRATTGGEPAHPLLVEREEKRVLVLVLTSDRGLCGAFNTNINKAAEREWHRRVDEGQELQLAIIGRKGRDYFTRRNAPIMKYLQGVWDSVNIETARHITNQGLAPFKLLHMRDGVNMTLGLPFVRTSPDHGVAYDAAASGQARPDSLIAALKLAEARALARARLS